MTLDERILAERRALLAENHEYDSDNAWRKRFINALAADAPALIQVALRTVD